MIPRISSGSDLEPGGLIPIQTGRIDNDRSLAVYSKPYASRIHPYRSLITLNFRSTMSVALQTQPKSPHPFTPRKMQSHLPHPTGLGHSAPPVSPHTPGKHSSGYTTPSSGSSQVSMNRKPSMTASTREAKKRRDLKMRVVTQPEPRNNQRNSMRWGANLGRNSRSTWREALPENATDLLTKLYEALIMAKNCEVGGQKSYNI